MDSLIDQQSKADKQHKEDIKAAQKSGDIDGFKKKSKAYIDGNNDRAKKYVDLEDKLGN